MPQLAKTKSPNSFTEAAALKVRTVTQKSWFLNQANGVLDQDVVVPVMTQQQKRFAGKIERASFDRAFHTPDNQEKLANIVTHPCIPKKGGSTGERVYTERFSQRVGAWFREFRGFSA